MGRSENDQPILNWLYTRIALRALKISCSDIYIGEGWVAVKKHNFSKTSYLIIATIIKKAPLNKVIHIDSHYAKKTLLFIFMNSKLGVYNDYQIYI